MCTVTCVCPDGSKELGPEYFGVVSGFVINRQIRSVFTRPWRQDVDIASLRVNLFRCEDMVLGE